MIGAIFGDIVGSVYEFNNIKTKDFELFGERCFFTDDTVMTVAVADALLECERDIGRFKDILIRKMHSYGKKYPNAGYGGRFGEWLYYERTDHYNSFGNGSAMRVSPVAWYARSLEEAIDFARASAEITHNHPEGIKGAESVAAAIWLARYGSTKEEIRDYITREFGYDLSRTCDEIRPTYRHVESCQKTVPEAVTAFLEGRDFEDVIRTAVSLGGDCDTLTCIAGSIAEAFYGVPAVLKKTCEDLLPEDMRSVLICFNHMRGQA